jgi:DNA-directed RNA polymerase subunit RPC12/RpoP
MTKRHTRLLLHACPRCHGDLFPDIEEDDVFACLQCGRRILKSQLTLAAAPQPVLVRAA